MAPAASTLAAAPVAAAASKRPAASDAEALHSSTDILQGGGDDAAVIKKQQPARQQLECPRCGSTNTKFCYYNNYSTAQPRHYCRACRRYWTHGGTLRDVPVGGACRRGGSKRRRVSAEPSASASPPPSQTAAARTEDAFPDLTAFPFLSDGSFLPQLDLGGVAPAAFSWPPVVPDFFDGFAPWDDGTVGATGVTGAWSDIAGLELSWPPPGV